MKTITYVSSQRVATLPAALQRAVTWPALAEMESLAQMELAVQARGAGAPPPPLLPHEARYLEACVRQFVGESWLPPDPSAAVYVAPGDDAPPEVRHETKAFSLRARRFDLVLRFTAPRPLGGNPIEGALQRAREVLAVPLEEPLERIDAQAQGDAAFLQIASPPAGSFLGICPYLWIYAEPSLLVCFFEYEIDLRPTAEG